MSAGFKVLLRIAFSFRTAWSFYSFTVVSDGGTMTSEVLIESHTVPDDSNHLPVATAAAHLAAYDTGVLLDCAVRRPPHSDTHDYAPSVSSDRLPLAKKSWAHRLSLAQSQQVPGVKT
eukprot:5521447-Amphidinium_carterae.1